MRIHVIDAPTRACVAVYHADAVPRQGEVLVRKEEGLGRTVLNVEWEVEKGAAVAMVHTEKIDFESFFRSTTTEAEVAFAEGARA